jgi:ribosomal protein S12 methylthiotransferase accessory factor
MHSKRTSEQDAAGWSTTPSSAPVRFGDLPSFPSEDVVTDLQLMVDRLAAQGLSQVIVVDLSPPTVPASVVRVVVPGLESWSVDRSKLGQRARTVLDGVLAQLLPTTDPVSAGQAVAR